ncbi:MAG: lamin tail domain-containing protein, partial [Bacteroidota bacterium]
VLLNSGYSDFQAEPIPNGSGSVTGVLKKDGKEYQLVLRDLNDLEFVESRCVERRDEFSSNELFFSELADPNNNSKGRFVEIFNSDGEALDLEGWKIRRYTNDNIEVSSETSLSGMVIEPNTALVIAADAIEFEQIYGFWPDMEAGLSSPADSNGDDNLELIDPLGNQIDIFGIIGEDGSGTQHEFEDGRAIRNPGIDRGNPVFSFAEWTIYNDTGAAGTIKSPQNAPEDFTPGIR